MTQAFELSGNQLSPEFQRARRVSRTLAVLLGIGFWIMVVGGLAILGAMVWALVGPLPADATIDFDSQSISIASLSSGAWLGAVLAIAMAFVPSMFALKLGRRIFRRFASGEVFVPATVADIRSVSFWMIVLALTTSVNKLVVNLSAGLGPHGLTFNAGLLFFGLCTYVAAYVMTEAQRIADDNAGIV